MLLVLIYSLGFLLILFGVVILIKNAPNTFNGKNDATGENVRVVLIVKNRQEVVEGLIRNILTRSAFGKLTEKNCLTVIDMSSDDETLMILERLKSEYEYIEILTENEKEKVFEGFK